VFRLRVENRFVVTMGMQHRLALQAWRMPARRFEKQLAQRLRLSRELAGVRILWKQIHHLVAKHRQAARLEPDHRNAALDCWMQHIEDVEKRLSREIRAGGRSARTVPTAITKPPAGNSRATPDQDGRARHFGPVNLPVGQMRTPVHPVSTGHRGDLQIHAMSKLAMQLRRPIAPRHPGWVKDTPSIRHFAVIQFVVRPGRTPIGPSGEPLGQVWLTVGAPGGTRDAHSAG
jgi:hypothetical protein